MPPTARRGRAALTPLLVVCGVLAAMIAAGLTVASGGQNYAALGLPDAGPFTEDGLSVLGVATELGAALCVGSLLLAAFLVPPKRSSVALAADGYAAVRAAGWAALFWCVASLLTIPFTVADQLGRPVSQLTTGAVFPLLFELDQPRAWLITAGISLVVAVGCWLALTWGWATTLFLVAITGLFPLAVTGHSSAGGSHDIATDSLLYHLVGAALWVGGLVALLAHARRGGAHLPLAARRFSALALVCWLVMAVSGVLNALVRLPVHDLFRTGYGLIVLAKIGALCGLGVLGYVQRRRSVRALLTTGARRELLRLSGVEMLVMFVTIGISAALSRTAPPTDGVAVPSTLEVQLGYSLSGRPTVARLLVDWRFDLIYGTAAIVAAALYLLAVRRLRGRGESWPVGRSVAWSAGCLVLLLATSSGIGRYAPAVFSVHLGSHLALALLAPLLLVLGGPVTLALRALPTAADGRPPGPREWLLAVSRSPVARVLTQPVVAFVLFAGSFYALYLTGLFETALNYHWAHLAMNALFLLAGCVFYWPVVGVDPAPRPLSVGARLGLTLGALPFFAYFAIFLLRDPTAIGAVFYRGIGLPWPPDLLADQRVAGVLALVFGLLPLLAVAAVLLARFRPHPEPEPLASNNKPRELASTAD
jgi:putative copper resistance protein D